jgi:hypothetical protein
MKADLQLLLQEIIEYIDGHYCSSHGSEIIERIHNILAEKAPEPVAWRYRTEVDTYEYWDESMTVQPPNAEPLYAAPPPASPDDSRTPTAYAVRYEHAQSDVLQWDHPKNAMQMHFAGKPLRVGANIAFYRELFAGPTKTLEAAIEREGGA